jgi:hydrogenase maturation protease
VSLAEGVLVICYGNPLRGDDGAGWRAAELLVEDPRALRARVIAVHQLTPELAEDVSRASLLVLVDASEEPGIPGSVSTRPLKAEPVSGSAFSHHVDPARLLKLSETLFGQSPRGVQVTIRALDLEPGTALSSPVGDAMATLVDAVIDAMDEHRLLHA